MSSAAVKTPRTNGESPSAATPRTNGASPSAATPSAGQGTGPKHLQPDQIKYLVFEGGGGKGYAFLGALQALDKILAPKTNAPNSVPKDGLKQIRGVAGTSAGAITALMVSIGMTPEEIKDEVDHLKINTFFDLPNPRLMPKPFPTGYESRDPDGLVEKTAYNLSRVGFALNPRKDELKKIWEDIRKRFWNLVVDPSWAKVYFLAWNVISYLILREYSQYWEFSLFLKSTLENIKPPYSTILVNYSLYWAYLQRDMGIFSGAAAREYFDNLISKRAAKRRGGDPEQYRSMSFEVFHTIFKKDLLMCGSNFSTGTTVLFSHRPKHTPKFPVADAVRISMGIPVMYKPYIINQHVEGWPPCGTYVDGGWYNNLPYREIEPQQTQSSSSSGNGSKESHTLSLRLEIEPARQMSSIGDILHRMFLGLTGNGESQVLGEFENTMIVLDTVPLSTFEFNPKTHDKDTVYKRSRRQVYRYFEPPKSEDQKQNTACK